MKDAYSVDSAHWVLRRFRKSLSLLGIRMVSGHVHRFSPQQEETHDPPEALLKGSVN